MWVGCCIHYYCIHNFRILTFCPPCLRRNCTNTNRHYNMRNMILNCKTSGSNYQCSLNHFHIRFQSYNFLPLQNIHNSICNNPHRQDYPCGMCHCRYCKCFHYTLKNHIPALVCLCFHMHQTNRHFHYSILYGIRRCNFPVCTVHFHSSNYCIPLFLTLKFHRSYTNKHPPNCTQNIHAAGSRDCY